MKRHLARLTKETLFQIGVMKEPIVALIDHWLEINVMSMDFYKKDKWPINTKLGRKIRVTTRAMEKLHNVVV